MSSPQRKQSILSLPPPWLALSAAGLATAIALRFLPVAQNSKSPWSVLLEPLACVAHGVAVTLLLGLLLETIRRQSWRKQLDRLGDDLDQPNWAAAAMAQVHAQFAYIPQPKEIEEKLAACAADWERRIEFRSNAYIALAFLVGLPFQLQALVQIAVAKQPVEALREAVIPLAAGGLEVLAIALPAFLLQRSWSELFQDWKQAATAEETRRRIEPSSKMEVKPMARRPAPTLEAGQSSPPAPSQPSHLGTFTAPPSPPRIVEQDRRPSDGMPTTVNRDQNAVQTPRPDVIAPYEPTINHTIEEDDELAPGR